MHLAVITATATFSRLRGIFVINIIFTLITDAVNCFGIIMVKSPGVILAVVRSYRIGLHRACGYIHTILSTADTILVKPPGAGLKEAVIT